MNDLNNLDWTAILEKLNVLATSLSGKEILSQLAPLKSQEEAFQSFQDIKSAQFVLLNGHRPFMQSLDFYPTWMSRLKKNATLKPLEIKDIRFFCLECLALKEALSLVENPWARDRYSELIDAAEPLSAIDTILTPGGEIRSDASEKLFQLTREKDRLSRELQTTLDHLIRDHQLENMLQDKFVTTREGRWVVPVKSGMQHFIPGIIHGSSQTKQTVFIEPEKVVPINNRLRQIEVEIEEEIERLLIELSRYLMEQSSDFSKSRDTLENCDVRFAQAQFSIQIKASPVQFSEDTLQLTELRHPLLELSGKPVISNTVVLNFEKSLLLLSGPNAGGKTVLLKSIGLASQMARCGLLVCAAENSTIPFFKTIQLSIGDAQNVNQEISTFAGHLTILNNASKLKGSEHLILIDEICGSTDPEEGSAIARSFIESFSENKVFGVITSHLGPLKSGWEETRVLNGSMEYNNSSGRPTYQFLSGIPGDSLAIQTAKRVGVSPSIIERATLLLSPETRQRLSGLEQIERIRQDVLSLQDHLKKEIRKNQELKLELNKKLEQFEKEKNEWLEKSLKKAEKKVEEAISAVKVDEAFKKHTALQEIKFNLPEIIQAKPMTQNTGFESAESFSKKFPPGSKVFVPSLNQDGIIQSEPNSKGEVLILSNSFRLQIPWTHLRIPDKPQNPTSSLVRRSSGFTISLDEESRVIDLRGKTVNVALEELEIALDRASTSHQDRLKIIHGHGTEALKKAIRTYLSRSLYVKKWKAGTSETGGDGLTWVELNYE